MKSSIARLRGLSVAIVVIALLAVVSLAQETPPPVPADELTADQVRVLKAALAENEALAPEDRDEAASVYDLALLDIAARGEARARHRQFEAATTAAPDSLAQVKATGDALPAQLSLPVADAATREEVQSALQAAEAESAAATTRIAELRAEATARETARRELPDRIAAARQRVNAPVEDQLLIPIEDDPPALRSAREVALTARRQAQGVELLALETELESYVRRADLMQARIELAERNERLAAELVTRLRERATAARTRDAEAKAEQAEAERLKAAQLHPVVGEVAELNADLARRRVGDDGIPAQLHELDRELADVRAMLNDVQTDFEGVQARINKVGMTDAIGLMLRRKRDSLPAVAHYRDRVRARDDLLATAQLEFLDVDDKLKTLSDMDAAVANRMAAVESTGQERAAIETSLRRQLEAQRGYLQALRDDYDRYVTLLFDLDETERNLIALVEEYRSYVAERILWIRSTGFIGTGDAEPAGRALAWLFSPANWGSVANALVDDLRRYPVRIVAALVVLALMIFLQPLARSRIRKTSEVVSKNKSASYWHTVQCFVAAVLVVLPGPTALWIVAWRLTRAADVGEFGMALATALHLSALLLLGLRFLWRLARPGGLAAVHFGWPEPIRLALRRHMFWLLPATIPLAFVFLLVVAQSDESFESSLGRLLVVALTGVAAAFTHMVFRPGGALMNHYRDTRKADWLSRGRLILYALLMLAPVGIGVLACIGFTYTAAEMLVRYAQSVLFGIGLAVANGMMHRWFELSEQRLALRARKRKLKARQLQAQREQVDGDATGDDKAKEEEPVDELEEIDLLQLRQQTRSLRRSIMAALVVTGFFLIWIDVLPALGFLDRVELWSHSSEVVAEDGTITKAAIPVTLGRLLLSFGIIVLTVLLTRTFPGFMDTTLLLRMKIAAGVRYAIKSITRYVLAAVGAVIAFQAIGIGWTDVQWLVAGFSVGLGFGLQEIFANFVSGLILLIERPIRVGDTVTVNGTIGRVTRINMRSTTIEDWDRKELVVPNKLFITTELVNWTLSSDVLRMVIKVGVAYGSDLKKVEEALMSVARNNPRVLKSPEAHTMFFQFGDSALDWELRVFVGTINDFRYLRDDLHKEIDAAFREAGIEIAFPQRTVWVRDFDAPLRVEQTEPAPKPKAATSDD